MESGAAQQWNWLCANCELQAAAGEEPVTEKKVMAAGASALDGELQRSVVTNLSVHLNPQWNFLKDKLFFEQF